MGKWGYRQVPRKVRTINCDCPSTYHKEGFTDAEKCECFIYPEGYPSRTQRYEKASVNYIYVRDPRSWKK